MIESGEKYCMCTSAPGLSWCESTEDNIHTITKSREALIDANKLDGITN
jgi:hypothetical protein